MCSAKRKLWLTTQSNSPNDPPFLLVSNGLFVTPVPGSAKLTWSISIPPEQREKAKGIVANMQGVAGGVAGTVGGGVKGVVDTAGNTVCHFLAPPFFNLLMYPPTNPSVGK